MVRLIKPTKIKKGMLLVDRKGRELYEVLKVEKGHFEARSVFSRTRKYFDGLSNLMQLQVARSKNEESDEELVTDDDFFVLLDDEVENLD